MIAVTIPMVIAVVDKVMKIQMEGCCRPGIDTGLNRLGAAIGIAAIVPAMPYRREKRL